MDTENVGPLAGIRVVEVGTHVAGPFAGQLLGDFGAEVIKIEQPTGGDPMRHWGPVRPEGYSLWWEVLGRNKKSVTVDLRQPEGQALVRRLVLERADVLLENFRPGTLERWGLDPAELQEVRPDLIVARVSGYGQTGPYARRAGFGSIGEAMGGIRHVTGEPDRPPSRVGVSLGDALAGVFAAYGVAMSLVHRERTRAATSGMPSSNGHGPPRTGGQVVDVAIYEAVLALMESLVLDYELTGHVRGRTGSTLPNVAPSNIYRAADGVWVLIAANADAPFRRLVEVMEQPQLAEDPRFATHLARGEHAQDLDELIGAWARGLSAEKLVEVLSEHGVPASGIYTAKEMLTDPHFAARESLIQTVHPVLGEMHMQAPFPRLSATPGSVRSTGPAHGQHNDEVLGDLLGLSNADIDALRRAGVVAGEPATK
ncbi:CaiB/BaiF CoA transferase family protein [Sporichthya polymorpha]|uniref:CaiB/BaiF CoA transferase family protein n=1 Tax=Sporichthya polymorpha TaxID=35751 RepID=UPI00036D73D9|nr:CoA transferase [Sporichthya polymorpha]